MKVYDNSFFDWVDSGARQSATQVLPFVQAAVTVRSVVDVGCGRGTWLQQWQVLGVNDVLGIDGDYVDRARLHISAERFLAMNIATGFHTDRKFDLAQSLEVGEHLPLSAATGFVENLCKQADVVLFSAAQPGQGGELHLNEQEPGWWRNLFAAHGFAMFDAIRPHVARNTAIEPWYRYNTFIFANGDGEQRLSAAARASRVPPGQKPVDVSTFGWRVRKMLLKPLPIAMVTRLSRLNYRIMTRLRNRQAEVAE